MGHQRRYRCLPPLPRLRDVASVAFVVLFLGGCVLSPRLPPIVKIGLVAPFEGTFRSVGYDAIYAARMAIREINAAGGIHGWQLELVAYDDRGNADMALQAARNLVVDEDVIAVLGHYRPETTSAAASVYAEAGLPLLTLGSWGAPAASTWHLMPAPAAMAQSMLVLGDVSALNSIGLWGTGPVAEVLAAVAIVEPETPSGGEMPGLVMSVLPPAEAGEKLLHWRDQGWEGRLVGDLDLALPTFAGVVEGAWADTTFVTPYPLPEDLAGTAAWMDAYQAMGPHVPEPGPYALPTYEAVYLVADVLEHELRQNHSVLSRTDVGAAIGEVERTGWLGTIIWDAQHFWRDAPLYSYRWTERGVERLPEPVTEPAPGS